MRKPEIQFNGEQALLLQSARAFALAQARAEPVRTLISGGVGYSQDAWREMTDLGWTGLRAPEIYGGSGLSLGHAVPVLEALGRHLIASPLSGTLVATHALVRYGDEPVQSATLPRLAQGGVAALAVSEPGRGWDHGSPGVAATRAGGLYRLQGVKRHVAYADAADFMLLSLLCEGEPRWALLPKHAVPRDALTPETPVDETQRSFRIDLAGIALEPEWLLKGGGDTIGEVCRAATLLMTAEMSGGVQGAIDLIVGYLKTRKQFGRLIGAFQGLKHPTAELFVHAEMARSLVYAAATHLDDDLAPELVSMAKAKLSDLFVHAGDRAVQFHGGLGFTYDCDAGLFLRRALWMRSQFGDGRHHRQRLESALLGDQEAA